MELTLKELTHWGIYVQYCGGYSVLLGDAICTVEDIRYCGGNPGALQVLPPHCLWLPKQLLNVSLHCTENHLQYLSPSNALKASPTELSILHNTETVQRTECTPHSTAKMFHTVFKHQKGEKFTIFVSSLFFDFWLC